MIISRNKVSMDIRLVYLLHRHQLIDPNDGVIKTGYDL